MLILILLYVRKRNLSRETHKNRIRPKRGQFTLQSDLTQVREMDNLFIYLGFYVAFDTEQVISRRVVGRAEETST